MNSPSSTLTDQIFDDRRALCALVRALCPVIRGRVRRALARLPRWSHAACDALSDPEDIVQEILVTLFDKEARVLRGWDQERGASLSTFVGIVAEHRIASILRRSNRRPTRSADFLDTMMEELPASGALPETRVASRELADTVIHRLQAELSPRGFELFCELIVFEEPIESVCARHEMTPDAAWAWRSRLRKKIREVCASLDAANAAI